MNCADLGPVLPRLAEKEGTPRVALDAARHLAACRVCAERLLRLRELNRLLDDLPEKAVPASFVTRVLRALPRRSTGALVLALALAGAATAASGSAGGGGAAASLRGPIEVAAGAMQAVISLATTLLRVLGAILEAAQIPLGPVVVLPGFSTHLFGPVIALALLAGLALAGSGAALGRGALATLGERIPTRPICR